jgi:myo-inositol 2-dehydrogenase / D-chiro-inositol 1-dehydrogenase
MISFCQFGAGRIGAIHAGNIARHPGARLRHVVDVDSAAATRLAAQYGAEASTRAAALADPTVDAVLIASSTDTHAELIEAAARAGKAVFCEKPIDLDTKRVESCLSCLAVVQQTGTVLMVGFNRRFDPNFAKLHAQLRAGRIGKIEMLAITSRDPGPPPLAYIKVSGGMFRDMMIHDLDMARWLLGEEPVEVFAAASCLVDPAIGAAGDVDSAMVTLKTASGTLCQISNSRRASYGYDQRIEAHGEKGMLRAGNVAESTLEFAGGEGIVGEKPLHFFLERYAEAYRSELDQFIEAVAGGTAPPTSGADGLRALALADAAVESLRTGRSVRL